MLAQAPLKPKPCLNGAPTPEKLLAWATSRSRRTSAKLIFYRDLFLFFPLLLTSWAAGALLLGTRSANDTQKGLTYAAVALFCLLLVRRRLALLFAVVAFVASRMVSSLRRPSDWRIDVFVFAVGVIVLVLLRHLHESKLLRRVLHDDLHEFSSDETTLTDLLVGVAGLLTAFVVLYVLSR